MIIGVDPGVSGGIVFVEPQGEYLDEAIVETWNMPETTSVILGLLKNPGHDPSLGPPQVYIEDLATAVHQGRFQMRPPQVAKLHGNFRLIEGICRGLGYDVHLIRSQEWQARVGVSNVDKLDTTGWKNLLADRARLIYPQIKVTLAIADALLIAAAATLAPTVPKHPRKEPRTKKKRSRK